MNLASASSTQHPPFVFSIQYTLINTNMLFTLSVYARIRKSALPYAYFLFLGLYSHNFSCRAISITNSHTPSLSGGLLSRHCSQLNQQPRACFRSSCRIGSRRDFSLHSTTSTDAASEECVTTSVSTSKWEFLPSNTNTYNSEDDDIATDNNPSSTIRNILVCGDGDLSYSAEIAPELEKLGIKLYATVLEKEDVHNEGISSVVYKLSISIAKTIIHNLTCERNSLYSCKKSISIFQIKY